ncbi:MAG: hypothetical protein ACRDRB_03990 [Pseudonocardiaceae bacterium]
MGLGSDTLAELGTKLHLAHPLGVKIFSCRRLKNGVNNGVPPVLAHLIDREFINLILGPQTRTERLLDKGISLTEHVRDLVISRNTAVFGSDYMDSKSDEANDVHEPKSPGACLVAEWSDRNACQLQEREPWDYGDPKSEAYGLQTVKPGTTVSTPAPDPPSAFGAGTPKECGGSSTEEYDKLNDRHMEIGMEDF